MTITYKTKGTCSSKMTAEVEDGVIRSLQVEGGCDGNLQGISKLVVGMQVEDVIERLEGIRCGRKATSCPGPETGSLNQPAAHLGTDAPPVFFIECGPQWRPAGRPRSRGAHGHNRR